MARTLKSEVIFTYKKFQHLHKNEIYLFLQADGYIDPSRSHYNKKLSREEFDTMKVPFKHAPRNFANFRDMIVQKYISS